MTSLLHDSGQVTSAVCRETNRPKKLLNLCAIALFCAAAVAAPCQTFNTLVTFGASTGGPIALLQGADGNLWGITGGTGTRDCGNVYYVTLAGELTTFPNLPCDRVLEPFALLLGQNGVYYGISYKAGPTDQGTIFKVTPSGGAVVIDSFTDSADGYDPIDMMQASNGLFYGVTARGGLHGGKTGFGTLFTMTPAGVRTVLYNFDSAHGIWPGSAPVEGIDGNFYGTTTEGGAYGVGTVYKITPSGDLTLLHSFGASPSEGSYPYNSLVQAPDGYFYGETSTGGPSNDGTLFRISRSGAFTNLHNFSGSDGSFVVGGLVLGTDGLLYGGTSAGGANNLGTLFSSTLAGSLTTLHSFDGSDGESPFGYMLDTNGVFYGVAGTTANTSVIFSLSVGMGSFVETLPTAGLPGRSVIILGTDISGATDVSFNGSSAAFTVVSDSEITATVPAGATTGSVTVTIPSGTLTSNVFFKIL
jgi:uncharacterized repeat protein (TIGR03803 family)